MKPDDPTPRRARGTPGWLLPLILLLIGAYAFWVLPGQLGDRPVKIQFEEP